MKNITRRDFIKLSALLPLSLSMPALSKQISTGYQSEDRKNVLIIVFDAFSSWNMSLYGYPRPTTPNIDRLADNAIVYHQHYAGSNFTTPGTASLLTGADVWDHRAFNHGDTVSEAYQNRTIFDAFQGYHKLAYTHNMLADTLLHQFSESISDHTPRAKLFLHNDDLVDKFFHADHDTAAVGWARAMKSQGEGRSYSLYISRLYSLYKQMMITGIEDDFPRGLPNINSDNYYVLEDGIDWLTSQVSSAPAPHLAYFHYLPPHFPYNTRHEFVDRFQADGYHSVQKPSSIFKNDRAEGNMERFRQWYDEYILYVDAEFARLYHNLEAQGFLKNTWLVLTSDHGEMFERGITGHQTPAFYQPVLQIPLLIFPPGQSGRQDIYENTSAVDLLPTLLRVNGMAVPDWTTGSVLPPFGPAHDFASRSIFALRSKGTGKTERILRASSSIIQENFKLTYIFGYDKPVGVQDTVELFDIADDPDELHDISSTHKQKADQLLEELLDRMNQADENARSAVG